jgi:hypothetical protein
MIIRKITEQNFFLNEYLIQDRSVAVQFEIGLQLSFTFETNSVYMTVRVYQHYPDTPADQILADIQIQHVFEIPELYSYQGAPSQLILPRELIITIIGLSVSHTRALFLNRLAGTALQENILPILNPAELAKQFFPEMFQDNLYD